MRRATQLTSQILALVGSVAFLVACSRSSERVLDPPSLSPVTDDTTLQQAAEADRPAVQDILLITIDTLRADALGFSGNISVATPNLDRLAAEGWVFDRAHAHNVVTLPSHANILTGRLPFEHGIRDNSGFRLPAGTITAASVLKQAGFATGAFIGAAPLDVRYGLGKGFDVYDDDYPKGSESTSFNMPERRGDEVIDRAVAWWSEMAGRRRFLWVHLFDPHAPYLPAADFAARHRDQPYLGEVEAVDSYLGRLLEPIWQQADALVVFTADHGEALGDHGESSHGLFAYESTLRVPLVLWRKGLLPRKSALSARHIDLLPTMLSAAGVELPDGLAGRPLWDPSEDSLSVPTYFESLSPTLSQGWAPLRGILSRDYKLIELPIPELYDLAADPQESRNLYAAMPEVAGQLAELLPAEPSWPPQRDEVTVEEIEALQAIGYVTGPGSSKSLFGPEDDPKNLVHLDRKVHQVVDLYHSGRLQEALEVGRGIIEERPDMGAAYPYVAQVLLELGRNAAAISLMQRARALGIASDSLLRQLGLSLAEAGFYEQAVELLEPYQGSDDPAFLLALAEVLSEAGRQDEAEQLLARVLAGDADDPVGHQQLALVHLRRQLWEEAAASAGTALRLNSRLDLAWNYLGTALYNLGQPREALEAWDRALAIVPNNPDVLYNVSVVAADLGDLERARRALEVFVAIAPPDRYGVDIEAAQIRLQELVDK